MKFAAGVLWMRFSGFAKARWKYQYRNDPRGKNCIGLDIWWLYVLGLGCLLLLSIVFESFRDIISCLTYLLGAAVLEGVTILVVFNFLEIINSEARWCLKSPNLLFLKREENNFVFFFLLWRGEKCSQKALLGHSGIADGGSYWY